MAVVLQLTLVLPSHVSVLAADADRVESAAAISALANLLRALVFMNCNLPDGLDLKAEWVDAPWKRRRPADESTAWLLRLNPSAFEHEKCDEALTSFPSRGIGAI